MRSEIEFSKSHVFQDASLEVHLVREAAHEGYREVSYRVENRSADDFRGVLRFVLRLRDLPESPWFMVPGFFYGENRRTDQLAAKLYPRFDPAVVEPAEMTSSWWDVAADRTAMPLAYMHANSKYAGLGAMPHYEVDGGVSSEDPEPQVGIGFSWDGAEGYMRVSVPACEEPFCYRNQPPDSEPLIRRTRIEPGGTVGVTLLLFEGAGPRHAYQQVLEQFRALLSKENQPAALPDPAQVRQDAMHGIVAGHYHPGRRYFVYSRPYHPVAEQIANGRGVTLEWHQMTTGFVNGLLVCHSLLAGDASTPDPKAREAALNVADHICTDGISPSGLFWADFMPAEIDTPLGPMPNPLFRDRAAWGSGWLKDRSLVHSRTIADACDHLGGMIGIERGRPAPHADVGKWEAALQSNLRKAMRLQLPDGRYGQYYNAIDGNVAKQDGCGGLLWIPAMIKAIGLGLGDVAFQDAMKGSVCRAGHAYAGFVEEENIWGAPEDNDSPTSEDGMNAVMAYSDLYGMTGEDRWLDLAVLAADWMLTFRKAYNEVMPPDSIMGRYGLRSCGGDFASASNNHLHVFEVLCTRHLGRLSEWTANPYYRERALDHWAFASQYLSREDGMFDGFRGAMAEQFYWTDWGSWGQWSPPGHHIQKGSMAPFTAVWCAAVLLLSASDVSKLVNENSEGK